MGGHLRAEAQGFSVSVAVTPEKLPRLPKPGEQIPGRKEARRYTVKAIQAQAA